MNPLVARAAATEKTIAMFTMRVDEWGVSDCVMRTLAHLQNMGHTRHPLANSKWTNEEQALRAFAKACKRAGVELGMGNLITACGLLPIGPLDLLVGDLVGIPADEPWGLAMGVYAGNQQALASVGMQDGSKLITVGSSSVAVCGWRVEPCLK